MIWTQVSDGIVESGWYRLNRVIQGWEIWWTHPKNFKLIGKTRTLSEAKGDVIRYAEQLACAK
jgi:hypothetical protein